MVRPCSREALFLGVERMDIIAEGDMITTNDFQPFLSSRMLLFKCNCTWSSIDKADKNAAALAE